MSQFFVQHSLQTAPDPARRAMKATAEHLGYLPAGLGMLANSPKLLEGFLKLSALFESTSLEPLARETLIMTIATRNGCHLCVAMHTGRLEQLGASADVIAALRNSSCIPDPRLAAIRAFALAVFATAGAVDHQSMAAFLAAGFTVENALEVVLGIGAYTLSTFANRMTEAPVDAPLARYSWEPVTV